MKVLITGAAGFIGSHLHEQLRNEGHEVLCIDNFSHASKNPINEFVESRDIRSKNVMELLVEPVDIVFHLAAQIHVDKSIQNPLETISINVNGTLNVLEACRKYKKKLVFASSSEVYGSSQTPYMSETHQLDAQSPYAASKVAGDRLCKAYMDTYGLDICILRNFNTFGPWQNDGGEGSSYGAVIGIFTRAALRGEPITIFGDGTQERDYMYITDALQAYKIATGYTGVLNAGSGKTVSIKRLAERIIEITQSKSPIIYIAPRAGEVQRLCADISRIHNLGFTSSITFSEGLAQYVTWYKQNLAS